MAEDQETPESGTGQTPGPAVDPLPAKKRRSRAKLKTAARALARAEALNAGGVELFAELDRLRRSFDQLVQGLDAMLQTQATQTELLKKVLVAATAPTDPERDLAIALDSIAAQLVEHGGRFVSLQSTLNRLPEAVASAVGVQLAAALDAVR